MKKTLFSSILFLLLVHLGFSQTVTGKVIDEKNEALIGASVTVKATNTGAITDNDGNFSIAAPQNAILLVSFVGYAAQEIAIGTQTTVYIRLKENSALNEVIVTALGISREKKALGYAAQEIKGSDITAAPAVSPMQNLAGKVAGLTLTAGSYGPGSSTRIVLRGERLIAGDNQPLYIIDGVPMDNSINGSGPGEFNGADNGDGISSINPDDIENISVLKGPNAAALYGSRANNGAIIITTKKGASGKVVVNYSTNYSAENASYVLKNQSVYGQGDGGKYAPGSLNSWGPTMNGTSFDYNGKTYQMSPQDAASNLLQTGNTWNNNLSFSVGNDKVQTLFSVSNLNSTGIIPNNELMRTNLNLRTNFNVSDKLKIDTKITYLIQEHKNRPSGGEEASNAYSDAIRLPTSLPLASIRDSFELIQNGGKAVNNFGTGNSLNNNTIIGNPWWMVNRIQLSEKRNRVIGLVQADYEIVKDLKIIGRLGLDKYTDTRDRRVFGGSPTGLSSNSAAGDYQIGTYNVQEFNAELLGVYNLQLTTDLGLTVTAGANRRRFRSESVNTNTGGLDFLNLFTISNAKSLSSSYGVSEKEIQSAYGMASFNFKNYLYLDVTGRNDWSSTLPTENRSYFYPSVSASAILSEMVKLPETISFAKIRASLAQVGNDVSAYQLQQYLNSGPGVAGTIASNQATRVIGSNLLPQQTKSFEIGADVKFLKNRLGIDVSYYTTNTINQVVAVTLTPTSGFNAQLLNAGDIQNTGVEILLTGSPIKTKDLKWDITLNYARNRNQVIRLAEGLTNYGITSNRISTISAKVGERLGELYVKGFARDASGNVLVDQKSGLPIYTSGQNVYAGNIAPDWSGGINNAISYKGFRFDFLIDYKSGGVVVSHTQAILASQGNSEQTIAGRDNTFVYPGVQAAADGKTSTGSANTVAINSETYWKSVGNRGGPTGEAFVYDATVLRLRQVTLSYALPKSVFTGSNFIRSAVIGLYGRNLWFNTKAPFDPEVSLNNNIGGQGVDFYAPPSTRSLGFNLNVGF